MNTALKSKTITQKTIHYKISHNFVLNYQLKNNQWHLEQDAQ